MRITPDVFSSQIIRVGYYDYVKGSGHDGPALRNSSDALGTAASRDEHFTIPDGHVVSYSAKASPVGGIQVLFGPPTDNAKKDAILLPFLANNISSAVLDDRASTFFTDTLSGCAIFIDELPSGDVVVHHANASGPKLSPKASQTKKNPSLELHGAVAKMSAYHEMALEKWPSARQVGSLFKSEYNQSAKDFVDAKPTWKLLSPTTWFPADIDFIGGTTVMGFRISGEWEFWYQTYGGNGILDTQRLLRARRFIPV